MRKSLLSKRILNKGLGLWGSHKRLDGMFDSALARAVFFPSVSAASWLMPIHPNHPDQSFTQPWQIAGAYKEIVIIPLVAETHISVGVSLIYSKIMERTSGRFGDYGYGKDPKNQQS